MKHKDTAYLVPAAAATLTAGYPLAIIHRDGALSRLHSLREHVPTDALLLVRPSGLTVFRPVRGCTRTEAARRLKAQLDYLK